MEATGLVPGFADYLGSTTVESERIVVVVLEKKLGLSIDEDASGDESGYGGPKRWEGDVGSDWCWSKRWARTVGGCCRRCQASVVGGGGGGVAWTSNGDGQ